MSCLTDTFFVFSDYATAHVVMMCFRTPGMHAYIQIQQAERGGWARPAEGRGERRVVPPAEGRGKGGGMGPPAESPVDRGAGPTCSGARGRRAACREF